MRCDVIAQGIVNAAHEVSLVQVSLQGLQLVTDAAGAVLQVKMQVPLIVRLEGTNVEKGKQILADNSDVAIITASDLDDAAKKAVQSISQ